MFFKIKNNNNDGYIKYSNLTSKKTNYCVTFLKKINGFLKYLKVV